MDKLLQLLQIAFANNFKWYNEAHQNHWDIAGPDFSQYHEFLRKVYEDAQESIDDYGEKIRQMGAYPQADLEQIVSNTILQEPANETGAADATEVNDPVEIFTEMRDWNETIIQHLQDTYDAAGVVRQYGIQNFLAERIDSHMQFQWQINAILGVAP